MNTDNSVNIYYEIILINLLLDIIQFVLIMHRALGGCLAAVILFDSQGRKGCNKRLLFG